MDDLILRISEAKNYVFSKSHLSPKIGLILGSGLGAFVDDLDSSVKISYKDIPHFPVSTVVGHEGALFVGKVHETPLYAMSGRFHYYEGYSMQQVVFPVRVMHSLGIDTLIVTNACGGLNDSFYPGALMLIKDHINLTGDNPLIGPNIDEIGPRFPDMTNAYNQDLIQLATNISQINNIELFNGIYAGICGPAYLTKAELKMLMLLGADAVGMSTIPEVIAAKHCNIRVLGISCVTDIAIPDKFDSVSHEQVMLSAKMSRPKFTLLLKDIIKALY